MNGESLKERIKASEAFTVEDAKELKVLLSNKSLMRALNVILTKANAQDKLTLCDIQGQQGLNEALTRQGFIRGQRDTIDTLIELSQSEEENND